MNVHASVRQWRRPKAVSGKLGRLPGGGRWNHVGCERSTQHLYRIFCGLYYVHDCGETAAVLIDLFPHFYHVHFFPPHEDERKQGKPCELCNDGSATARNWFLLVPNFRKWSVSGTGVLAGPHTTLPIVTCVRKWFCSWVRAAQHICSSISKDFP